MSREQTKAAHYIQLLDGARCEGNWAAVPELVRKIRKHAPGRTCLTLTAECEHAVTQAALSRPSSARPSTATSSQYSTLSKYIPQLGSAIEDEKTHVEDEFQARVCLGWIHWLLGEPAVAAGQLPNRLEEEFTQLDGTNKESAEWTKVCAAKALFIKGSSMAKIGAVAEALETFESGLPILVAVSSAQNAGKELRVWAELFLTEFCIISSQAAKSKTTSISEIETLSAFRAWGKFWDSQGSTVTGGYAPHSKAPRRQVWMEYYITLSNLLRQDLPFPAPERTISHATTLTRPQQRAELKSVEAKYEGLLLSEVRFPKADEVNEEVETFVDNVMRNWAILCGRSWREQDLGEGGAEAISRGVLDILYRAATKTFHSTAILRHLFTVHLSIAEFDLAFKAFDTYMEIVKRSRARIERTGETEPALDNDETVLRTTSECIKALCRYGSRQGAEKARDISRFVEDWLEKFHSVPRQDEHGRPLETRGTTDLGEAIAPEVFALAWRCIGISHAQWARLTPDASLRSDIQLRAVKCLRKSLLPEYESTADAETVFALGTLLAERRELTAAIDVVKSGLLSAQSSRGRMNDVGSHPGRFAKERSLVPLWHLMALLLSVRQEFSTAARSCEGAFEQFQDPRNLWGESDLDYRSDHLNEKSPPKQQGVVDDMDDFEKENILEVKITQLTLVEVLEGPEVAVNSSDELLNLYTRLFGDPQQAVTAPLPSAPLRPPPKSSAGTIKSIKGSIFGRSHRSVRKSLTAPIREEKSGSDATPQAIQTTANPPAPTIQVTNESGGEAKQHNRLEKQPKIEKRLRRKSSAATRTRSISAGRRSTITNPPAVVDGDEFYTPPSDSQDRGQWIDNDQRASQVGVAISDDTTINNSQQAMQQPLPPKSQQMAHKEKSLKPASSDPAKAQDTRLPNVTAYTSSTSPATRFPKRQQKLRRTSILVKVWLLISGFYRRASMYDDARGAIAEAQKLVQTVEAEISSDTTGTLSTSKSGWGGGKSVNELWGDVFSERGALAAAESLPYVALGDFESALTHFADHPSAIVGLSNILLDIYNEDLLPPPSSPSLVLPGPANTLSASAISTPTPSTPSPNQPSFPPSTSPLASSQGPLGMSTSPSIKPQASIMATTTSSSAKDCSATALLDRLAARDRAYGLLTTLSKLGTGWNYPEAWFALARAYELGGQLDKSRECLWWCVELEEGRAVRDWSEVVGGAGAGRGGYVL